jgi:hypothetical protein
LQLLLDEERNSYMRLAPLERPRLIKRHHLNHLGCLLL